LKWNFFTSFFEKENSKFDSIFITIFTKDFFELFKEPKDIEKAKTLKIYFHFLFSKNQRTTNNTFFQLFEKLKKIILSLNAPDEFTNKNFQLSRDCLKFFS
jgi:hypothetical protein